MAENISIVGKDYRTVAMENAYDLAVNFVPSNTGNTAARLVAIAKLTYDIYQQMIGYSDLTVEGVQAILENKS
jgi:hypothetical protein